MSDVFVIDVEYDESNNTFSTANKTASDIMEAVRNSNYEVIPILRIVDDDFTDFYIVDYPCGTVDLQYPMSMNSISSGYKPGVYINENGEICPLYPEQPEE